ncbi:hypothetical protein [Marinobacter sp. CA1]|uniref:hypothetical protein n=1 Tax=Marinobacter sp. CA1 TaxID=2817656 RepID=UPI001D08E277|nr:hypothetical protein [Marinobacter sp. CA1]UDL03498.1 hypothetical protein J2887_12115 [Marinobacter sp. CA1]
MSIRTVVTSVLACTLLSVTSGALASETTAGSQQSYESCSMITSEYVTVLQLLSRGFDGESLSEALPDISPQAGQRVRTLTRLVEEQGLVDTYSQINSEYARCARTVYQRRGKPQASSREGHFHFCAGENKVRYEVLMSAVVGADRREVLPQLASQHQAVANAVFDLYLQEGPLTVFDSLASELKACLNRQR